MIFCPLNLHDGRPNSFWGIKQATAEPSTQGDLANGVTDGPISYCGSAPQIWSPQMFRSRDCEAGSWGKGRHTHQSNSSVTGLTKTLSEMSKYEMWGRKQRIGCRGCSGQEVEARGSGVQDEPGLHTESEASLGYTRTVLKQSNRSMEPHPGCWTMSQSDPGKSPLQLHISSITTGVSEERNLELQGTVCKLN